MRKAFKEDIGLLGQKLSPAWNSRDSFGLARPAFVLRKMESEGQNSIERS
jgi:hypothetical protein